MIQENINIIEKKITDMGYPSPKEFLNIVKDVSNSLKLDIVKNHIKWASYQRKNNNIICYTHMFSTINTKLKPTSPAMWMLPTSPLPESIYLTFKYAFDFTFNIKTKEIQNLKVLNSHHNHQKLPSNIHYVNLLDGDSKDLLKSYIRNNIIELSLPSK
jgi:hypothetical protein